MPYIKNERKEELIDNGYDCGGKDYPANAGELNYLFTKIGIEYLEQGLNYQRINDVIGALEGAKLELYRRLAAPYEDTKIEQNGDVYPKSLLEKVNPWKENA